MIIEEIFTQMQLNCETKSIYNGTDALKFLQKEGEYKDAKTPDLIILDLNLPGNSGHDILDQLFVKGLFFHVIIMFLGEFAGNLHDFCGYDVKFCFGKAR